MEIHGCDIVIESNLVIGDSLIRLLIQDHWPKMVYEIDEMSTGIDMLVYKDEDAKKKWDEVGWSEENDITMIGVIFRPDLKHITFVIDDNKKNKFIIDDIEQFIKRCDND